MVIGTGQNGTWTLAEAYSSKVPTRTRATLRTIGRSLGQSLSIGEAELVDMIVPVGF